MQRIAPLCAILLCLVLAAAPSMAAQRSVTVAAGRAALVIGNAAYADAPLANPANDAADMAEALERAGFKVIHLENADQRTMERAIRDFGAMLGRGSVGLFYFAGHGMQVDGRNYLIPVGADIRRQFDVKYEAVDAGRVLDELESAGNGLNIVILDACRDNPFTRAFRSGEKGLARMDAPTGSLIAYSTAPGATAADGQGRNGVYTRHLLEHMLNPGLAVEEVFKQVRVEVMSETDQRQVPWEASSLTGSFVFVDAPPEPARPQRDEELDKLRREMTQMRALIQAQEDREKARLAEAAKSAPAPAPASASASVPDEEALRLRAQNEELRQQIEEIKQLQLAALEQNQGRDPEKDALRKELQELRSMRDASEKAARDRQAMADELERLKGMLDRTGPGPAPEQPAPRRANQFTMAVAPYRLLLKSCAGCREHVENILVKAQVRSLGVLDPAYSSVPPGKPAVANPLPKKYASDALQSKLWGRSTPDREVMLRMGRDLGVDAVLALRLEYMHPSPMKYTAYLLDVDSGEMFSCRMQRPVSTGGGSTWTRKMLGLIDDMVNEFDAARRARTASGKP